MAWLDGKASNSSMLFMSRSKPAEKFTYASNQSIANSEVILNRPTIRESGIVDVEFGENVIVINPVNLYGCSIGSNVFIGPFVEIQRNVTIGHRTKVQSHTFICELVDIGDGCFIGHGVMFVNHLFSNGGPALGDKTLWKKTKIGNNVSIGSNTTLLPVLVCDYVVIGAGSVVTKEIYEPGVYAGNPARLVRKFNKQSIQK